MTGLPTDPLFVLEEWVDTNPGMTVADLARLCVGQRIYARMTLEEFDQGDNKVKQKAKSWVYTKLQKLENEGRIHSWVLLPMDATRYFPKRVPYNTSIPDLIRKAFPKEQTP